MVSEPKTKNTMNTFKNSFTLTTTSSNSSFTPTQSNLDQFSHHFTIHKLNGNTYLHWSQSVLMYIFGRNKDYYLIGMTKAPKNEDPTYKGWKTGNNMVMSWLINSMNLETGETFLLYSTAVEI